MLLDINASIGHWPFMQRRYNTCDSLLERMNRFGTDVSVISNMNGIFYKNTQSANEELYNELKASRRFMDRFIPFAIINPIYAGWRDDLQTCITKMGMRGVRVYPKYHDYDILDPSLIELVKRVRDYGLPVAFTVRMIDSRIRSWMDIPYVVGTETPEWNLNNIIPVIKAVPDAKYIILNPANSIILRSEEDTELIRRADILFDTSGRQVNSLPALLKTYGEDKFAFGTHSPFLDYLTGLLRIETLRESEADESTKELMRWKNANRVLGG